MRKLKESGIPFVGKIPSNWRVLKNKRCFQLEKNIVGEQCDKMKLLSLTKKGIVYKDINNTFGKIPESYETYQKVKSGQLVMCLFDLDISSVFSDVSNLEGMISPAYKVYNCNYLINNRYAGYWFDFCFDGRKYMSYSKSLRYVVNTEDFNNIEIIVPPVEIQEVIANFLDKEVSEIDNAIKKTKETIEDYRKLKVAIITKVTSKGLNLKCEMKESNINLIGKIPKHWELKKVKYVVDTIAKGNGITKEEVVANGDTPCIRYGEIYTKYNYFFENCITRTNKDMISSKRYISNGDLLFAGTGELVEEIGKNITYLGTEECLAGGDIVVIKHHQDSLFLSFALNSAFGQGQKSFGKAKLKVVHISGTEIGNVVIPVPPIEEQKEIGLFLKEKCNEIDNLIENKEKIVEELEQYKKSVIYEYVTGKKEVK